MNLTAKLFLLLGGINALLAVIMGAFGAHALKTRLDESLLNIYQTGSEYHFYHALGLVLLGVLATNIPVNIWLKISGWSMLTGIVLFSGSLYILSIFNLRWLGMVTPAGGLLFIIAWISLIIAVLKQ
ncbi:MAG: DUF423 domain-containing protein [Proteobacteria bacterium]|nr:DUF423 domain-containing protein [Pseudomonadota bacterium]